MLGLLGLGTMQIYLFLSLLYVNGDEFLLTAKWDLMLPVLLLIGRITRMLMVYDFDLSQYQKRCEFCLYKAS